LSALFAGGAFGVRRRRRSRRQRRRRPAAGSSGSYSYSLDASSRRCCENGSGEIGHGAVEPVFSRGFAISTE